MPIPAFNVFISSTTGELAPFRAAVADVFEKARADVDVQRDFPTDLDSLASIDRIIETSQFLICLIGNVYGTPLPESHESHGKLSYTQHEYKKALSCYLEGQEHPERCQGYPPQLLVLRYDGPSAAEQDEHSADLQRQFRAEIDRELRGLGVFYHPFDTLEKLKHMLQGSFLQGEPMKPFKRLRWTRVKQEFQQRMSARWQEEFAHEFEKLPKEGPKPEHWTKLEEIGSRIKRRPVPFLADQCIEELTPVQGCQLKFLSPEAFVVGRDTENEARASLDADWRSVNRPDLITRITGAAPEHPGPSRLFFVSGGGVGKTTNLKWIAHKVNAAGSVDGAPDSTPPLLAVFVEATTLGSGGLLEAIVAAMRAETRMILEHSVEHALGWADKLSHDEALQQLQQDRKDGSLLIILDGLDHLTGKDNPVHQEIQGGGSEWARCPIILSGRPHVLMEWTENVADRGDRMLARDWRFMRIGELETAQQRLYLGRTATEPKQQRYDLVPPGARRILMVPRVLSYVAELDDDSLKKLKGAAHAYHMALCQLIGATIERGGTACEQIGRRPDHADLTPETQVPYVMALLGAMAFVTMKTVEDDYARQPEKARSIDRMLVDDSFKRALLDRMSSTFSQCRPRNRDAIGLGDLENDLKGLFAFSTVVHNNLLERAARGTLFWDNRSVLAFFVAYWLSRHAAGTKPGEGTPEDCLTFKGWLFYPDEFAKGDRYYEVNALLAEMPEDAIEPYSWASAAAHWYDPGDDEVWSEKRKWSSEMLYRSWHAMHAIAGEAVDDWWDVPYQTIYETSANLRDRPAASLHARKDAKSALRRSFESAPAVARDKASQILCRYRGDLDRQLSGAYGRRQRRLARAFTDERTWRRVPAGPFEMGRSDEGQGFPEKTLKFWDGILKRLEADEDPHLVAMSCNPQRWFTGAQGAKTRRDDIEWLEKDFREFAESPLAEREAARNKLKKIIEDRWRRADQFSKEGVQHVAGFEMQRLPVLQEWYWLFAPGHKDTVRSYLGAYAHPDETASNNPVERDLEEDGHKAAIVAHRGGWHPPADHPVTYVSWFDCWAFCQWARWHANGTTYQCRLPHEPEWEYAARHKRTGFWSPPAPVTQDQPYWWGDRFYEKENEGTREYISRKVAHAQGLPGATRAPRRAKANGLGFKDMLGNVWEWSANVYDDVDDRAERGKIFYSRAFPTSPPSVNNYRAMRGGLWYFLDLLSYCSHRFRLECDDRDYKMGFRVVREEIGR